MNSVSSPVAYPPTSSPREASPRKRRKLETDRTPLQTVTTNTLPHSRAGFFLDDSDSDKEDKEMLKFKYLITEHKPSCEVDYTRAVGAPGLCSEAHLGMRPYRDDTPRTKLVGSDESSTLQDTTVNAQRRISVKTCSGLALSVTERRGNSTPSFEKMIAARSAMVPGRARKSYYGIDIHDLLEGYSKDKLTGSTQQRCAATSTDSLNGALNPTFSAIARPSKLMWTEKYRARKFTDLVGDERTHRSVLRWIKAWDAIVFPSLGRHKAARAKKQEEQELDYTHRKVLLIAGPPGLGKTTLAHVCAKQAGYEVQEINASDERNRDVVKGRIRDMVCTENIRTAETTSNGKVKKVARPICVVVDEVDGVVGGHGTAGDGGFIKALVDLLILDQKNSHAIKTRNTTSTETRKKKKGDSFRLRRPVVLICNDLYHPSLRLLRQSNMVEIMHVRKPALSMIIPRLQMIFEKEGIPSDIDGVRQLCEATWGVSTKKDDRSTSSTGDGDIRGILVVGEWVASKLRAEAQSTVQPVRLTKKWLENNILGDLMRGGEAARGLGRGSPKDIVERIFTYNAGFSASTQPASSSAASSATLGPIEAAKYHAIQRLKEMIDCSGEDDRLMTDCFSEYPTRPFQDDNFLSKPCLAYDWLDFYDTLSNLVHTSQEWELAPYLSSPILAFHHLFASTSTQSHQNFANSNFANFADDANNATAAVDQIPFTGPRASYEAHEAYKVASAALIQFQSQLCLSLLRSFRSIGHLSTDLLPYVLRILNPDIKPVIVGGSEKGIASVRRGAERELVQRAVNAMISCGIRFDRSKIEGALPGNALRVGSAGAGWVYRMEPALDALCVYDTTVRSDDTNLSANKVRYAVRQVLDQEWKTEVARRDQEARVRRVTDTVRGERLDSAAPVLEIRNIANFTGDAQTSSVVKVRKDFFGRLVVATATASSDDSRAQTTKKRPQHETGRQMEDCGRIWVTYREGYSNAVRKGITLKELLEGL